MNKLIFVALSLVLAIAFFIGNDIVLEQAEAVEKDCPSQDGNTASHVNQPTTQPVSAQISNTQTF